MLRTNGVGGRPGPTVEVSRTSAKRGAAPVEKSKIAITGRVEKKQPPGRQAETTDLTALGREKALLGAYNDAGEGSKKPEKISLPGFKKEYEGIVNRIENVRKAFRIFRDGLEASPTKTPDMYPLNDKVTDRIAISSDMYAYLDSNKDEIKIVPELRNLFEFLEQNYDPNPAKSFSKFSDNKVWGKAKNLYAAAANASRNPELESTTLDKIISGKGKVQVEDFFGALEPYSDYLGDKKSKQLKEYKENFGSFNAEAESKPNPSTPGSTVVQEEQQQTEVKDTETSPNPDEEENPDEGKNTKPKGGDNKFTFPLAIAGALALPVALWNAFTGGSSAQKAAQQAVGTLQQQISSSLNNVFGDIQGQLTDIKGSVNQLAGATADSATATTQSLNAITAALGGQVPPQSSVASTGGSSNSQQQKPANSVQSEGIERLESNGNTPHFNDVDHFNADGPEGGAQQNPVNKATEALKQQAEAAKAAAQAAQQSYSQKMQQPQGGANQGQQQPSGGSNSPQAQPPQQSPQMQQQPPSGGVSGTMNNYPPQGSSGMPAQAQPQQLPGANNMVPTGGSLGSQQVQPQQLPGANNMVPTGGSLGGQQASSQPQVYSFTVPIPQSGANNSAPAGGLMTQPQYTLVQPGGNKLAEIMKF